MLYRLIIRLRQFVWKLLGLNKLQNEVETLHFFLNTIHKPSEVRYTSDINLRILQECDLLLLLIVVKILRKYNLEYWLDYGTLLGCIRHGDCIPWDDDTDISMMRDDYCKAKDILKQELEPLGFTVTIRRQIGVGYKHLETGIWLDIFANDSYYTTESYENVRSELEHKICKCGKICRNRQFLLNEDKKRNIREKIIGGSKRTTNSQKLIYLSPEFSYSYSNFIFKNEWIFPLKQMKFGNYYFSTPNNSELYLTEIYGNNYMDFPKSGVLHHDFGRGPLSTWSKRSNVDMIEVKEILENILSKIS